MYSCLPSMYGPGSSVGVDDMWVEFVVCFCPGFKRFFSRYSSFLLSSKTNTSKFQFDLGHILPSSCTAFS